MEETEEVYTPDEQHVLDAYVNAREDKDVVTPDEAHDEFYRFLVTIESAAVARAAERWGI